MEIPMAKPKLKSALKLGKEIIENKNILDSNSTALIRLEHNFDELKKINLPS